MWKHFPKPYVIMMIDLLNNNAFLPSLESQKKRRKLNKEKTGKSFLDDIYIQYVSRMSLVMFANNQ